MVRWRVLEQEFWGHGSLGRGGTISKPSPTIWSLYLLIRVLAQLG